MNTSSEESLISVQNGSQRVSTPDLVRLDTENLGDIIVSHRIFFCLVFVFFCHFFHKIFHFGYNEEQH